MSHLLWTLGANLRSSGGAASALEHFATSLALQMIFPLRMNSQVVLLMSASHREHLDGVLATGESSPGLLGLVGSSPSSPVSAHHLGFLHV